MTRPMKKVNKFLGMKISGYDCFGNRIWQEEITAIQKCGQRFKPGYYHFWLGRTNVTGTIEDCQKWTAKRGR